jgi:hypothetical protein
MSLESSVLPLVLEESQSFVTGAREGLEQANTLYKEKLMRSTLFLLPLLLSYTVATASAQTPITTVDSHLSQLMGDVSLSKELCPTTVSRIEPYIKEAQAEVDTIFQESLQNKSAHSNVERSIDILRAVEWIRTECKGYV